MAKGNIANPGSALGEAIGAYMEKALAKLLIELTDEIGYYYLTSGLKINKSGKKQKKLLLHDKYGNEYDIDGVISNEKMQPLILIESKYIRYKKHNRDKGSWICTAHPAIRSRYTSIRSSIAILAGNWSGTSLAMIKSFDTNIFLIPYELICKLLFEHGIDFEWGEKDKEKAYDAWTRYISLDESVKVEIGIDMVNAIRNELIDLIKKILDDSMDRRIEKVKIELKSTFGEVREFEFDSIEDAIEFLSSDEIGTSFLITDSITLFEPTPTRDDDEDNQSTFGKDCWK